MEKADVVKLSQMLQSTDSANVLLGLQLVQTFGLEKEFLTEVFFLGYFAPNFGKEDKELAQKIYQQAVGEELFQETVYYAGIFKTYAASPDGSIIEKINHRIFGVIDKQ